MIKKFVTASFLLLLLLVTGCAQEERFTTIEEIKSLYPDLIQPDFIVEGKNKSYSFTINKNLPSQHLLRKLGKDYQLYTDYINWNYTGIDAIRILTSSWDSALAGREYINLLKTDSLFNNNFLPIVYYSLKQKNIIIRDYSPPAKLPINQSTLLEVAARFFYASNFDSTGNSIEWSICVGKNPYANDSTITKLPSVEAFCFMVLMKDKYRKNGFNKDFMSNAKQITDKVKLINGTKNKLQYARNKMTSEMSKNENLREVLLSEYRDYLKILPFYLNN